MQITLKQSHIEAAIKDYVKKAGITFPVEEVGFTAGRGRDGMTATVDVEDPFVALDGSANTTEAPAANRDIEETQAVNEKTEVPADKPKTSGKKGNGKKQDAKQDNEEPEFAPAEEEEAFTPDSSAAGEATDPLPEKEATPAEEAPSKAKSTSLFSN